MGVFYSEQKNFQEAEKCYLLSTIYNPIYVEAYCNLGVLAKYQGELSKSIDYYQKALNINPNLVLVKNNMAIALNDLGIQLRREGKLKESIKHMKKALFYFMEYPECYYNLGIAYSELDQLEKSIYYYQMSVHFNPKLAEAYNNMGILYKKLENTQQAIECYKTAISLNPNLSETYNNLAVLYSIQGNMDLSTDCVRKAIQVNPNNPETFNNLAVVLRDEGKVEEAISFFEKALKIDIHSRNAGQNRLLALNFLYGNHTKEHKIWGDNMMKIYKKYTTYNNKKDPKKQIKVGYISPDFFTHSVSYFIDNPLKYATKDFKIYLYSNVQREDNKTQYFKSLGHEWRDIQNMNPVQICELIRNDEIDILIELAGHSANNKLDVMAMKPAPIQVTWIGYPNTTGLPTIDYRIVDSFTDPEDMEQEPSEKLIRLKYFLCYNPGEDIIDFSPPPYFKNEFITFGTFNNMAKITKDVVTCWIQIMKNVPNSRLVLKSKPFFVERIRNEFTKQFEDEGIDKSRIIPLNLISNHKAHLSSYSYMDISLDVFPYAGTTTTCETLFMGVPVITLKGNSHAHNVGVSLLTALGYDEFIAKSKEEYIKKAIELANDPEKLLNVRKEMRKRMLESDLCNGKKFIIQLEDEFKKMWKNYCEN